MASEAPDISLVSEEEEAEESPELEDTWVAQAKLYYPDLAQELDAFRHAHTYQLSQVLKVAADMQWPGRASQGSARGTVLGVIRLHLAQLVLETLGNANNVQVLFDLAQQPDPPEQVQMAAAGLPGA